MSSPASPVAPRLRRARWWNARLLVGVLLVAGSTAVGAKIVADADDTQDVWVATRDLAAGATLRADDVMARPVRLGGQAPRYLGAGAGPPTGLVLARPVAEGELLPVASVASGPPPEHRFVTVPVHRHHLPPGIGHGERVDVYVTPQASDDDATARPRLVLPGALVADVVTDDRGLGVVQTEVGVVLSVPPGEVAVLVAALREGAVDLVRVPAEST